MRLFGLTVLRPRRPFRCHPRRARQSRTGMQQLLRRRRTWRSGIIHLQQHAFAILVVDRGAHHVTSAPVPWNSLNSDTTFAARPFDMMAKWKSLTGRAFSPSAASIRASANGEKAKRTICMCVAKGCTGVAPPYCRLAGKLASTGVTGPPACILQEISSGVSFFCRFEGREEESALSSHSIFSRFSP